MAGTSKKEDVKSPQEIEEGIQSTPTVTWDPFTVLPKEIYLKIFEKLESSIDKQNFMNAHVQWFDLFKSNRVLFLCHPVFEVVHKCEENLGWELNWSKRSHKRNATSSYQRCRLVCHDWDNGIQKIFQLHEHYFKLEEGNYVWPNRILSTYSCEHESYMEPCERSYWYSSEDVKKDLEMFSATHPPSKNPFFSRNAELLPFSDGDESEVTPEELVRFRAELTTLLERYGGYIYHCKIEINMKLDPETCLLMAKWLNLMPELKTLEVKYRQEDYHPFSAMDLKAIEDVQLLQPEMKNLEVLQLFYLPSLVFNKLFGKLPQLAKIQINILKGHSSLLKNFELKFNRENMKEAFFTMKGRDDFKYLYRSGPFPALKKLVICLEYVEDDERKYQAYSKWPEWKMIWGILEIKFPSLEHLNMKLPKAFWDHEKRAVIGQSFGWRLNLPKLKKLWIALPNLSCIDFLLPCKALRELEVVLEHVEWNSEKSAFLGGYEEIKFNMDLQNMWESNIWDVFPKLCKLEIQALPKSDSALLDRYTYEKIGDKRKYHEYIR